MPSSVKIIRVLDEGWHLENDEDSPVQRRVHKWTALCQFADGRSFTAFWSADAYKTADMQVAVAAATKAYLARASTTDEGATIVV